MKTPFGVVVIASAAVLLVAACGGGGVSNEDQARRAYVGLDLMVAKSMRLGFDGFNAATSANIPTQTTTGAKSGTLTVGGQVDQGNSPSNKGMRLVLGLESYSDGDVALDGGSAVAITYAAPADGGVAPKLDLKLSGLPNGTFAGTLVGEFGMSGGLSGTVKLDLALTGDVGPGDGGTGTVRIPGTTTITGTATSGPGVFNVSVSL